MHEFDIELCCTGRGTHKLRRLGKIIARHELNRELGEITQAFGFEIQTAGPDLESLTARTRRGGNGEGRRERFTAIQVRTTRKGRLWVITCPTCGREARHVEKTISRVARLVLETQDTGGLDISHWS